jgi:hypothetical protein
VADGNAHSGTHSALLYENDNNADEMVFYSAPVAAEPDKWYRVGVWVKTDSVNTDSNWIASNITPDRLDDRLSLCFFFNRAPLHTSWDLTGGDQYFYMDQRDATGWTHYSVVAKAPSDAAGISVRARFTSFPTGYAWYDDFMIEKLEDAPNVLVNGDLETMDPGFWDKLNDGLGGAAVSWASDEAALGRWGINQQSLYSLKVVKSAAATDMVGWQSVNNADLYWNNAGGGDLYDLGFYAKTSGVNTSPATQDDKIGVWFKFYGTGTLIGEQFVEVDQSAASVDWTEYTGGLTVATEPDCVLAIAVMEKNATGTVWFDNVACNTNAGWTMGIFNGDAETPDGWMWWADAGHWNRCALVADGNAHSGTHSALLYENDNNADEMVFYSAPVSADPGKWYKVGVWVKTDSVNTDSSWIASNITPDRLDDRLSLCFFFHRAPLHTSWDLTGGDQYFYMDQRDTTGWTHYVVIQEAPSDAAGISVRARFTSFPTGYAWYDDFTVDGYTLLTDIEYDPTDEILIESDYQLANNYPNPFNPETMIEYKVPKTGYVALNIYNVLGQKIRTLVNDNKVAGTHHVLWDGKDDYGRVVATGVYIYQLKGENALITKRMTFIK